MKIIVNNEHEKKLVENFLDLLKEDGLAVLEEWDGDNTFLTPYDFRILGDNVYYFKVEIDKEETDLHFEETDFVEGVCNMCKETWVGFQDGYELTYRGLLELNKNKELDYCEDCYRKKEEE